MKQLISLLLTTSALVSLQTSIGFANPLDPSVVAGDVAISGEGTPTLNIEQTTNKAIIDWRAFDIAPDETTRFIQPSSDAVVLNRVTGGLGASQIMGTLSANGQVFVINPDGILFGRDAVVDVGGLVATTNDISNANFLSGNYTFNGAGNPSASVVNLGTITVEDGGFAALVAPGVRNDGTIFARLGQVALASGNGFSLDFYGDELITLAVDSEAAGTIIDVATGEPLSALVQNSGLINADGGTVQLTAATARAVVDAVVNNSGTIEANSVGLRNGKIVLSAATAGQHDYSAPPQTVVVSGTLSASGDDAGEVGGSIEITGEVIALTTATIDALGWNGGGTVLIGGDYMGGNGDPSVIADNNIALEDHIVPTASYVFLDEHSLISADALYAGDGGKVIVWSDIATLTAAAISARGGAQSGDGGFIETSGKYLDVRTAADASAQNGEAGTWLLDPLNVHLRAGVANNWVSFPATIFNNISVSGTFYPSVSGTVFVPNGTDSYIDTNVLSAALNAGNNVRVTTRGTSGSGQGNIYVESDIRRTSGSGTRFLDIDAANDIIFSTGVDLISTVGRMHIFLQAKDGEISGPNVGRIDTNGGVLKMNVRDGVTFRSSSNMPEVFGLEIFAQNGGPRRTVDIKFDNDLIGFTYQNGVGSVPSNGIQLVDSTSSYFELQVHNMDFVLFDRAVRVAANKPRPGVFVDVGFNYGADPSADLNGVAELIWSNPLPFPIAGEPPSGQAVPVLELSTNGDDKPDEYIPTSPQGIKLRAQFLAGLVPPPDDLQDVIDRIADPNAPQCLIGSTQCIDPNEPLPSEQGQSNFSEIDEIIRVADLGPGERRTGIDSVFRDLLDALNLNSSFEITDASYSPGAGSSGGNGGGGFIYPSGTTYDLRGECVALVVALTDLDYPTKDWVQGQNAVLGTLQPGTPVATFGADGKYDHVHTGVFVRYIYSRSGAVVGMYMIDQYNTKEFGERSAGLRSYYFKPTVNYYAVSE